MFFGPKRVNKVTESTITRLKCGDASALEEVCEVYGKRIYTICRRLSGNDADAEDLTQEAFLRVLAQAGSFSGRSSFSTWLFRLTVNHARNFLRAARLRKGTPLSAFLENSPPLDERTPEQAATLREESELLDRMLQELPLEQRTVVLLRQLEGLTYEEIAKVLGVPAGTVTSRLVRGRDKLRRLFQEAHSKHGAPTDESSLSSCPTRKNT